MMVKILKLLLLLPLMATLSAMAEEGAADARRHMVRGVAAIEMAESAAGLAPAAAEFRRATELDPTLSAAWYNLGSVQVKLGQFDAAIQSYKRYLSLSPHAEDAQKIQDEIIKLEYRQEIINNRPGSIDISLSIPFNIIVNVGPDTPAAKAGIKAGDRIQKVDGIYVKDLDTYKLMELLRGPVGTKVIIEVERRGEASPLSFSLVFERSPI